MMGNTVNERISELISTLKMSNNAFGKSINKTSTTINQITGGKNKPSFDMLEAICEVHRVNASWLMQGEGEMFMGPHDKASTKGSSPDSYLQEYLGKLESQFDRLISQLETKDSQIASLTKMLEMTLGKSEDVIIFKTTPVLAMYPGAGALEA